MSLLASGSCFDPRGGGRESSSGGVRCGVKLLAEISIRIKISSSRSLPVFSVELSVQNRKRSLVMTTW